jgi:transposase-like protein
MALSINYSDVDAQIKKLRAIAPVCQSTKIKRTGKELYGKQNYLCKKCGRQLTINPSRVIIPKKYCTFAAWQNINT